MIGYLITEHIHDWWGDDISGAATQKGDQYSIAFNGTKKTFEITEVIPGERIVWLCRKAYIDMPSLNKKDEWVGTIIIWTIATDEQGTTLTMLHKGLNKVIECYDVCEPALDYFIASLQSFLTTGIGTPFHKQEPNLEWEDKK